MLEVWITEYPTDFAAKGAAGALHSLAHSILSKTHLVQYGLKLLPFMEVLPSLEDQDSVWALEPEIPLYLQLAVSTQSAARLPPLPPVSTIPSSSSSNNLRALKASLPLVRSLVINSSPDRPYHPCPSLKQQLQELIRIANEVMLVVPSDIAEELTRVEAKYFLDITVSDTRSLNGNVAHC